MKKTMIIVAVFCLVLSGITNTAYAESNSSTKKPPLSMQIMGKTLESYAPALISSKLYLPLRPVGSGLGYGVTWNEKTKTLQLSKTGQVIKVTVGSKEALVNNKKVKLDAAVVMYKERACVPFTFVKQYVDTTASYDENKNIVYIAAKNSTAQNNNAAGTAAAVPANAAVSAKSVVVSGKKLASIDIPILQKGMVYIPLRTTVEVLGYTSVWNLKTKTLDLKNGTHTVKVIVGQADAYSNGKKTKMDGSAILYNGKVYVPLTFVKNSFNCDTVFDKNKMIVWVTPAKTTNVVVPPKEEVKSDAAIIGDIQYDENGGFPQLNITADKPVTYTSSYMKNPDRLVVDIQNSVVGTDFESKEIGKGGIIRVRIGQFSKEPQIARVVIDLENQQTCKLVQSDDKKSIALIYANVIQPVKLAKNNSTDLLTITGSLAMDASAIKVEETGQLIIDVKRAVLGSGDQTIDTPTTFVKGLKVSQFDVGTVRITVDMQPGTYFDLKNQGPITKVSFSNLPFSFIDYEKYLYASHVDLSAGTEIEYMPSISEDKKVLTLTIAKDLGVEQRTYDIGDNVLESITVQKEATNGMTYTIVTFRMKDMVSFELLSPTITKTISLKFNYKPQRIDQIKIVIDAGHGGKDPGAVAQDGTKEKNLTLDVANRLNTILKNVGFQTLMTRTDDSYVTLQSRTDLANQNYADFFMSIHFNAFSSNAKGIETLYYPNTGTSQYTVDSKKLADIFHTEVVKTLKRSSRGETPRPGLYVLNKTKMPAILEELGFITNPEELAQIKTDAYKEMAARALAVSIIKYFKDIQGLDMGIDVDAIYGAPVPGSGATITTPAANEQLIAPETIGPAIDSDSDTITTP